MWAGAVREGLLEEVGSERSTWRPCSGHQRRPAAVLGVSEPGRVGAARAGGRNQGGGVGSGIRLVPVGARKPIPGQWLL